MWISSVKFGRHFNIRWFLSLLMCPQNGHHKKLVMALLELLSLITDCHHFSFYRRCVFVHRGGREGGEIPLPPLAHPGQGYLPSRSYFSSPSQNRMTPLPPHLPFPPLPLARTGTLPAPTHPPSTLPGQGYPPSHLPYTCFPSPSQDRCQDGSVVRVICLLRSRRRTISVLRKCTNIWLPTAFEGWGKVMFSVLSTPRGGGTRARSRPGGIPFLARSSCGGTTSGTPSSGPGHGG